MLHRVHQGVIRLGVEVQRAGALLVVLALLSLQGCAGVAASRRRDVPVLLGVLVVGIRAWLAAAVAQVRLVQVQAERELLILVRQCAELGEGQAVGACRPQLLSERRVSR